jgi:hypothetical protein
MLANKIPFDKYFLPKYATETLINGNISECISYLRGLFQYGKVGMNVIHDELISIMNQVPERYEYVKKETFTN